MKGLPLAYNSDMQEDKEPFFDSVDTLDAILGVLPPMLASLTFRTERMRAAAGENFATATDLADYLVRKGLPFREAPRDRRAASSATRSSAASTLEALDARRAAALLAADRGRRPRARSRVEASLRARAVTGGTAPEAVRRALAQARATRCAR